MKKILIMALVFSLALVSFSGLTQGTIVQTQGYWVESYDGEAHFYDGDSYNADIVAVAMPSENVAHNTGAGGSYFPAFGAGYFNWDATTIDYGWQPDPAPVGDNVYFVSEHEDGYLWALWRESDSPIIATPREEIWPQYEPIAVPFDTDVGTDYIELAINAPKYTCRYGPASVGDGDTYNQGTFELLDSYAVFAIGGDWADWTYIGNADEFTAGPDDPLLPFDDQAIDPATVDTGQYTLTVTGLEPGTEYEFMVRLNFDFEGFTGGFEIEGEDDLLGTYTTFGTGASSGPITTEGDPVPEFGPGMLIPVVAIVGMFVAFSVYRRKKEE